MKISIITATYNAVEHLPVLIKSLQEQTDQDFEWVVADGISTDGSLDLLAKTKDLNMVITSEPDFGIYDALNRGIKKSTGEFYLVMGADDYLYPDAIANFKKEISEQVDVLAACIYVSGKVSKPGKGRAWLRGSSGYIAGHSVGTLFRKNLHDIFGLYSNKFPIAADQLFVISVFRVSNRIKYVSFVSGCFGSDGVSSTDLIGTTTEFFRVQLITGHNKYVQIILCFLRVLKYTLIRKI